jgi:hypothetical protein
MKANQLATQLLKQAGRFDRLAKRVRERLDPDDVHDLCVLARRMRATAWLGRQVCRGAGPKDLHRLLGEPPQGPGQAEGARRGPRRRGGEASSGDGLDLALARRAEGLGEALVESTRGKREFHALRRKARNARYLLEALGRESRFLKELQDHAGRAHDLEMLQELVGADARVARDERRETAAARRIPGRIVERAVRLLVGEGPSRARRSHGGIRVRHTLRQLSLPEPLHGGLADESTPSP